MKPDLIIKIAIVTLLSMVTSKIAYFGYTPNYAADTFSRQTFNGRFDHDVYKYRILSKYLLFKIDDWLKSSMPEDQVESRIAVQTPGGSERFYFAFYYLNTFFLVLVSIMVVLLLYSEESFIFTEAERNLIMFLVPVLISLTQFTVCCYDVSSYFFQLLILHLFMKFFDRYRLTTLFALMSLIFLSTLNRESSALSVSIISVLLIVRYEFNVKTLLYCSTLAASFLVAYIGLRYFVRDPTGLHIINLQAGQLFIDTNIIGMFFWVLFFYLPMSISNTAENRWLIVAFFLFSMPYIVTCLKDGVLWEVRLYIPLFLGSLFLSKLDTSKHLIHLTDLASLRMLKRQKFGEY